MYSSGDIEFWMESGSDPGKVSTMNLSHHRIPDKDMIWYEQWIFFLR